MGHLSITVTEKYIHLAEDYSKLIEVIDERRERIGGTKSRKQVLLGLRGTGVTRQNMELVSGIEPPFGLRITNGDKDNDGSD